MLFLLSLTEKSKAILIFLWVSIRRDFCIYFYLKMALKRCLGQNMLFSARKKMDFLPEPTLKVGGGTPFFCYKISANSLEKSLPWKPPGGGYPLTESLRDWAFLHLHLHLTISFTVELSFYWLESSCQLELWHRKIDSPLFWVLGLWL